MNKKLFSILTLLMVLVFVLAACGPKDTPVPATEAPATEAPATAVPATEAPTEAPTEAMTEEAVATIRIWADDTRSAILTALADDFFAEYQVKVIVEEVANIRDQFTVAAPAGEAADIIIIPHDQAGSLIASGLLAPMDLGDKTDSFVPVALEAFTTSGTLYGMPYATENMAFFYNTDLVDAAPTTWDEVLSTGKALIEEGKTTYIMGLSGTTYDLYPLFTSFGGYIFGQDADGNWNPNDLGLDSAGMIAGVKWLADGVAEGVLSDSTDWDTAHTLFETGEVPYLMAGPWALDRIRASGVPYAISNFPGGGRPFAGVQGFVVNALSENVLLAQAFLTEFVATDAVMTELAQAGLRPSAFKSVLAASEDPDLKSFGEAGANASLMPNIPEMGTVWDAWNNGVTLAITGEATPEEGMGDAQTQVKNLMAGALASMVNVPGSWQAAAGLDCDWTPDCAASALTADGDLFVGTFALPAGEYEVKVAIGGSWAENYGVDGVSDGDNYKFALTADGEVTFTYDPATKLLDIAVGGGMEEVMAWGNSVEAASCDYGGKILSIVATGEYQVTFNLCKPDPAFLAKAAFTPFAIYPEEWLDANANEANQETLLSAPVGTGAYYLESWNRGDSLVFKAFDGYWGDAPKADTLVFRWATESVARLLELQAGTVDYITNLGPDDLDTVENDPNLEMIPLVAPNILYIGMTNTFAPFDNVDVRQAIAMGIDRARIVENFYAAGSEVASHFTPCAIPGGCEGDAWYDFDPVAAKEMLAAAGFPDGFATTIYYRDVFRDYLPEPGIVAVELQTQLKQNLNIDADIVVMESGAFIDESTTGSLNGFHLLGWTGDYPHATNFLDYHFSAQNPQFGDPFAAIYEPLEAASQLADPAEAASLYAEANNAIKELVPMVPVVHSAAAYAARAGLDGVNNPSFGAPIMRLIDPGTDTLVFMKNAEPISLFCQDETDGESLDSCQQVMEALYRYNVDGVAEPALATGCTANADLTVWTCELRQGVLFHDGSTFDANDVIASWAAGIDAGNPNHIGNTGSFEYYSYLWDGLIPADGE